MTAQPASTKQLDFVKSLATDRDYPAAGSTPEEAVILERIFDVLGQKPVDKKEASQCIDYLLKRPRVSELSGIPVSRYALEVQGSIRFYEVVERKNGARYLNGLVGAPGDFTRRFVNGSEKVRVTAELKANAPAAAKLFADHFTVCAKCLSPLTDETSRDLGLGPVCRQGFGI